MGKLRILSPDGDRQIVWDQERVEAGDLDAAEALREAERIFEEQRSRGATAFRVARGAPAELLKEFDPTADQVVMVPRVVGG